MVQSAPVEAPLVPLETYTRKPFNVETVQVTEENLEAVATWVKGTVKEDGDKKYVQVKVHSPKNPRQTRAYVGDWVLLSAQGFKVYLDKAFRASFEKVAVEAASA